MSGTEGSKPPLRIFLSHAAKDHEAVHKLQKALLQQPNVQMFSTDQLSAGEDWVSQLKTELANSDVFILLLTPNAVESSWVLQELGAAWGLKKPIFAIYTDPWLIARIPVSLDKDQRINIKYLEHPKFVASLLQRFEEETAALHNRS